MTWTPEDARTTLAAITRELEDNRLTIIRTIINPDGTVFAEYRRTVRLPRGESQQGEPK